MTAATVTARKSYSTTTPAYTPAPQGKVSFSFRNVAKQFGGKAVLQGINLDVYEGQFVAVIGKSGCGKSTLLRLLAGLDKPTSGEIVAGVLEDDQKRTRIMFQEPRLLPWARVAANVGVGLTGIEKGRDCAQEKPGDSGRSRSGRSWRRLAVRPFRRAAAARCTCAGAGRAPIHIGTRRTAGRIGCADADRDATIAGTNLAGEEIHRGAGDA